MENRLRSLLVDHQGAYGEGDLNALSLKGGVDGLDPGVLGRQVTQLCRVDPVVEGEIYRALPKLIEDLVKALPKVAIMVGFSTYVRPEPG